MSRVRLSRAGAIVVVVAADDARKVAIVTGSSRGIGSGLADAYRREGWSVVGSSRAGEPSDDADMLIVDGDISHPRTAERLVDAALRRFGRIDTLINNAGIYISKPFTEYTPADYATIVGVNLTGFFTLTQLAIAEMLKGGGGHVVNITTTLVDYADSTAPSALTALTKGGLSAATKSLAIEYALKRHPGECGVARRDPDLEARPR